MKIRPEQMRLYAVTDRAWLNGKSLKEQVAEAIDGGAGVVQLREKTLSKEEFLAEAVVIGQVCKEKGAIFIVNDDVDIAAAVDADGVHLGQSDTEALEARRRLGPDKIIGISTHNPEEARAALAAGADYLGCGAAFVTDTKSDAKPISRETLKAVTAAVDIPVVAIGGITRENIGQLEGCGLAGVAVVSALFAKPDVKAAAEEMLALAKKL